MNKKRIVLIMTILTIVIVVTAIGVGVLAVMRKQLIIAAIMLVVTVGQVINYLIWKKRLR